MVNSELEGINVNQEFQAGPEIYGNSFPYFQVRSDFRNLYKWGYRMVRAPLKPVGSRQIDIDWQRIALPITKEYFNSVTFGSGIGHPHKPEDWDTLLNFMLNDEIPWILQQGIFGPNDYYLLSNEAEGSASNVPVVNISRVSGVAYVQYSQKHMMETGDGIVCQFDVASISNNQFDSERIITKIDDYNFSFVSAGSDGSYNNPSASTNFFRWHPRTIFRMVNRMATIVKAVPGFNLKTCYSILQGATQDNESNSPTRDVYTNVYYVDHAVFVGRGANLDSYDMNVYSYTSTSYEKGQRYFRAQINKGINGFGIDHFRVGEWNLWHNQGAYYNNPVMASKNIDERKRYMRHKGVKSFFFCHRWQNTEWLQVIKPYNKTVEEGAKYRDWWWSLIEERQPTVEMTVNSPIAVADAREKPAILRSNLVGFNIGQYEQSGTYNSNKVANIISFWKRAGVTKARVASGDPNYAAGVNACRNLALALKNAGIQVMFVNSGGGATDANWNSTIMPQLISFAQWAVDNGIPEINMFNELDYRQTVYGVLTNSVQKQIDAYVTLHAMFPGLRISTAIAQSSMDYLGAPGGWISRAAEVNALGLEICYNVYGDNGDFEQFKQRTLDLKTVYPYLRISEYNINNNWSQFPASTSAQVQRIKEKYDFLILHDLINYFFCWNWDHQNDQFALQKADGTFRAWYPIFFGDASRESATGRELTNDRQIILPA